MAEQEANLATLRSSIKFWLDISKFFYRSFRLKRYLGPQWFLVNMLALQVSDEISVGDLLAAMPQQTQKGRGNSQVELSSYLADLETGRYVDVILHNAPTKRKHPSFVVEATVKRLPKLHQRAAKYTKLFLERARGPEYAKQTTERWLDVLRTFFDFTRTFLVRDWEELLQDLANAREPNDFTKSSEIFNTLRGSLEYYIVLLSLWKARLLQDDEEGHEAEEIWAFHLATRHVSMKDLSECVAFLANNGILEQVTVEEEEPRFRLSELPVAPLEVFGRKLLTRRDGLVEAIRKRLEAPRNDAAVARSAPVPR